MADQSTPVQIGSGLQNAQPVVIVGGGGGGGGASGDIGSASDPAWNGVDASASLISIMKAIHSQNNMLIMEINELDQAALITNGLLNDIKTNTTPTP